jgi:hypothetical protein
MLDRYVAQARLLLSTLQDIANETVFALKGGTAINLFYRDMPRLSVDIDLTYLPVAAFLLSLHDAEPDFYLIGLPEAAGLPAVRWKLINLEKLKQSNPQKHKVQRDALERLFC